MKRLSFAACVTFLLATGSWAAAQDEARVSLTLTPGQVSIVREGSYHRVEITGVSGVLHPEEGAGLPDLPAIRLRVALPAGARPGAPRLEAVRREPLPGPVTPAPVQPAQPLQVYGARIPQPARAPVPADAAVYGSAAAYPQSPVTVAETARMGGVEVAFVHVTPFVLIPRTGALDLLAELTVVLPYTPRPSAAPATARSIPAAAALVANPAALSREPALPRPAPGAPRASLLVLTDDYRWERTERGAPVRGAYLGDMAGAFRPLADDHTALGLETAIVRVSDIVAGRYGDFHVSAAGLAARDLAEVVRNFVKDCAYPRWGTRYLLLGGDIDVVPARHILNTSMDWHAKAGAWTQSDPWNAFSAICRSWWPNCHGSISASPSGAGAAQMVDGDAATGWAPPAAGPSPLFTRPARTPAVEMRIEWSDAIWPAYNKLRLVWDRAPAPWKPIVVQASSDDGRTWSSRGFWPAGASEMNLDRGQWVEQGGAMRLRLAFPAGWPAGSRLMEFEAYGATNTVYRVGPNHALLIGSHQKTHEPLLLKGSAGIVPDAIAFDPRASACSAGWYYVSGPAVGPEACASADATPWVMIAGPASFVDGATHWTKAVHPVYYAADAYYGDVEGDHYAGGASFDAQNPWHDFDMNRDGWYSPSGDGIDSIFEVGVGRAPVKDLAQARLFVKKVRTYLRYRDVQRGTPLGQFARRGLLGAKKLWGGSEAGDEGYVTREHIMNQIWLPKDPAALVARYYEHPGPFPGALPIGGLVPAFNLGWNRVAILSHSGPEYCTEFRPAEVMQATNAPYYSVVFSYGCSPNAFDFHDGDSVSEAFVNAPGGGACAFMGNSRYGWGGDNVIEYAFWQAVGATPRLGDMLHAREARTLDAPWLRMNLLGDPALPVWSRVPSPLNVRASALPATGSRPGRYSIEVTSGRGAPVAGALVAVTRGGRLETTVLTDGRGRAIVTTSAGATIGVSAVSDADHPDRAFVPTIRSLASLLPAGPVPAEVAADVR